MGSQDNGVDPVCNNADDGPLVFAPRQTLTDEEQERADLHFDRCLACQIDLDVEYFLTRVFHENDEAV